MDDVLNIYGYKAVICLDPDTKTFRGNLSTWMAALIATHPMQVL